MKFRAAEVRIENVGQRDIARGFWTLQGLDDKSYNRIDGVAGPRGSGEDMDDPSFSTLRPVSAGAPAAVGSGVTVSHTRDRYGLEVYEVRCPGGGLCYGGRNHIGQEQGIVLFEVPQDIRPKALKYLSNPRGLPDSDNPAAYFVVQ